MSKFSERLKDIKKEYNITNVAISKAIGVNIKIIYRWENGISHIKSKELFKLAKFLNVSANYLIGLED